MIQAYWSGGMRPGSVTQVTDDPGWDVSPDWSPDGRQLIFASSREGEIFKLFIANRDGGGARLLVEHPIGARDAYSPAAISRLVSRWSPGGDRIGYLETGEERSLFVGPFMEMEVAPDGSAVSFCYGPGHMAMGLAVLRLEPPAGSDGLPRAVGEPEYVVPTTGTWHVHNGGWSPDSKSLVYTQDQDYGDLYELVESR